MLSAKFFLTHFWQLHQDLDGVDRLLVPLVSLVLGGQTVNVTMIRLELQPKMILPEIVDPAYLDIKFLNYSEDSL